VELAIQLAAIFERAGAAPQDQDAVTALEVYCWMMGWFALLVLVASCGRLSFDERPITSSDASGTSGDGAGTDSVSGACDPEAPFGAPTLVAGLNVMNADDGTFRAMTDELSGYFWSSRGGNTDIYSATRPDLTSAFTVAKLAPVNSSSLELDPTITPDGLTLVFRSNRPGGAGGNDLYQSTRTSNTGTFGAPILLSSLVTAQSDVEPSFSDNGEELYFSSNRTGDYAIWVSVHSGTVYQAPTRITEVDAIGADDEDPAMTADERTLFWRSTRAGGLGGYDIWSATRANDQDPFGTPSLVPNVNSAGDEGPSWISADGCRMYLSSNRAGTNDIYVAARP